MAIKSKIFIGSLVAATTFSAFILSSTTVKADTYTKTARIQVTSACTLTGNVATPHSRNVAIATYEYNIGETDFSAVCNDSGGFAVYAIGFTGDTDGNNKLVHSTNSSIYINTGLAESGNTSAWAMKLTAIENAATPTIHNGYSNYSLVPDDYVKVASYPSTTTAAASSMFKSYYAAYVSPTQSAGIYNGKVKYVMVHPSTAAAPTMATSFDDAFAAAGKTKDATSDKYKMQDMTSSICGAVTNGQTTEMVDIRDGTVYRIGKLLDDHCWLLDNLALDLTNSTVLATLSNTNTNADSTALGYLRGTTTRDPSQDPNGRYATSAVAKMTTDYSYSDPLINDGSKNLTYASDLLEATRTSRFGIYYNYCATSAGSYCFGDGGAHYGNPYGNAEHDICPAGWRIPSLTTSDYPRLYYSYNDEDLSVRNNKFRTAFLAPLSGYYINYPRSQESSGFFWSSQIMDNMSMYGLYVSSDSIYPTNNNLRYYGASIRCIAK